MTSSSHAIADVERETGLSKDTLRVWERRYGFPNPARDALGERRYDDAQVLRLRHLRRLLDAGFRAGQIVPLPLDALLTLQAEPTTAGAAAATRSDKTEAPGAQTPPHLVHWMALLRQHDARGLRTAMEQYLLTHGLARLVRDGITPVNVMVGQSWLEGQLAIFEEHLYSEVVQQVLRQALSQLGATRPAAPPRVLLTTVPGESHSLGLLMAECVMALEGCETLALGVQTPLTEIVSAAQACRADIVALGFSAALHPREVRAALAQLRRQLPPERDLWTGGQCPALMGNGRGRGGLRIEGHWHMARLEDIPIGVTRWRGGRPLEALAAEPQP